MSLFTDAKIKDGHTNESCFTKLERITMETRQRQTLLIKQDIVQSYFKSKIN